MEENPYAPPEATDLAFGVKSGKRADLKTVALAQKSIIVCILLNFGAIAARFLLPPELGIFLAAGLVILFLVQLVSVVFLATKVFNVLTGVIYAIGTIIPCIGLLILLIVNNKATEILRKNGHHVGLFGANLAEF
jgi:hypothetical protein